MSLTDQQSTPGNRVRTNTGDEVDVVARFGTEQGSHVILNRPDGTFYGVIAEGYLRDDEDTEHVGSTAEVKNAEYEKQQDQEREQASQDRADRVARRNREANPAPADPAPDAPVDPNTDPTDTTGESSTPATPTNP